MEINFELALKNKIRFANPHGAGVISTEDLFDLSITALDKLAVNLRKELRNTEESFINETKANKNLQLGFDIVKYVLDGKLSEREAEKIAKEKRERRKVLMEALAEKQNEALKGMTMEQLRAEIEAL